MTGIESFLTYTLVFAVSIICMSYYRDEKINVVNITGLLIVVLFAAYRFRVGADYVQYTRNFYRYYQMPWSSLFNSMDDGYALAALVKILYGLGGNQIAFGMCALLTVFPIYYVLRKEYPNNCVPVSLYWFLTTGYIQSFTVTSQLVAVGIMFYGIKFIYSNRLGKYIATVFVAFLFHKSALISTVLFFFWDHKNRRIVSKKRIVIILAATLAVAYFYHQIIRILSNRYVLFNNYSYFSNVVEARNRDFYVSVFQLLVVIIFAGKLKRFDSRNEMLILMLTVSTIIGLTGFTHPQFKRIAYYFYIPSTTLLIGSLANMHVLINGRRWRVAAIEVAYATALFLLEYYILGSLHYSFKL